MIEKEKLKDYANKLMFDMLDQEYETLALEFEILLKQISIMEKVEGLEKVDAMTFPFVTYDAKFRKDEEKESLSISDVLKNSQSNYLDQVRVPKVVEE